MLAVTAVTALGSGLVTGYLHAQRPMTPQEKLTLANIEAMGSIIVDYESEFSGKDGWCVGYYGVCDQLPDGMIISGGFVSKH